MPKRVGYLYDKMVDRDFIRSVIQEAAKGRRNRRDIARVLADLDGYVEKTYELVATESFVPSAPKVREIYDESSEKFRKIKMVPFWPDGVIQWMLVTAMKPVLMRGMHPWSCASIPGRGGKRIHKKIRGALRNDPKGTKYAAELDVAQYYPSISGKRLIWALARKIKDKRFLRTVYSIIESCGGGLAIGYYICQWLANFYLESLDQYIMTLPGVKYMTRYEEFFITAFDGDVMGLYDYLTEYENLDELNHLAHLISELDSDEIETLEAVLNKGDHTSSVADIINLVHNLDCYELHPGVTDDETLGRIYVEDMELLDVPDNVLPYFDFEAYGRDMRINEGGHFAPTGYLTRSGDFKEAYHGIEDIPTEHRIFAYPKLNIREQMAAYKEVIDRSSLEGERLHPRKEHDDR